MAIIDLDLRQRSLAKFFANRAAWMAANAQALPMPSEPDMGDGKLLARAGEDEQVARFDEAFAEARLTADVVLIDTPGGDTALSRLAHARADLIVTPMNDSFVDFDLLGQVDPVTLELQRPSIYSESVWEARKQRAVERGGSIDWLWPRPGTVADWTAVWPNWPSAWGSGSESDCATGSSIANCFRSV